MTAFLRTVAVLSVLALAAGTAGAQTLFRIEESTIADVQNAIKSGQTTCRAVVQAYLDRAKAYNGTCTALGDGRWRADPSREGRGARRRAHHLSHDDRSRGEGVSRFQRVRGPALRVRPHGADASPTRACSSSSACASASRTRGRSTRSRRSTSAASARSPARATYDRAPSAGPLPPGAPPECEEFRQQPDALERAAELDAQYGRNPDLTKLPMYCAVFSLKNWYDAKDMRATGGNDVNFAMDAPKVDSPDIAELRAKGAIIYAVATANNIGGPSARGAGQRAVSAARRQPRLWRPGAARPAIRTTPNGCRAARAVDRAMSVAANLVACSICEQSSASCKGPASRNNVVNLLTTKGILQDGGMTGKNAGDRAGIHCRTTQDAVTVLDAIKGYKSDDFFTAIPKALIPKEPYASFLVGDEAGEEQAAQRACASASSASSW